MNNYCKMSRLQCNLLLYAQLMILIVIIKLHLTATYAVGSAFSLSTVDRKCLSTTTTNCSTALNLAHISAFQQNLKPTVDPCVNFHEYACGNHPILNQMSIFEYVDQTATQKFLDIFLQYKDISYNGIHDPVYRKMLIYYNSCTNSADLTFTDYITEMQRWGLWHLDTFNWLETLTELVLFGYQSHFLRFSIYQNNASQHMMAVGLSKKLKPTIVTRDIYEQILTKFTNASIDQLNLNFRKLEKRLVSLVFREVTAHFEQELLYDDNCCTLEVTLSFQDLEEKLPEINWQLFIGRQMGRHIKPNDQIIIETVYAYKKLFEYINQMDKELHFLYMLTDFLNYLKDQTKQLIVDQLDTKKNCISHMRKIFNLPMAYIYEKSSYGYVRKQSDPVIHEIFAQLKTEFAHTLAHNKMKIKTKTLNMLLEKIAALRVNIGNLPINVTQQFYFDFVQNLNISSDFAFYKNHLHALKHHVTKYNSYADFPPANETTINPWRTFTYHLWTLPDIIDSSPFYFVLNNMIIIPMSYMQLPFYNESYWLTLIYGDLATTLGHELLHGFDENFIYYDKNGNYDSGIRTEMEDNVAFNAQIKCLNESTKFVNERIADVSGTRLVLNAILRADKTFLERNGRLFFVKFAQFFCSQMDADKYHDLDSLRLNYTLAQMIEFAEVYNCPVNSPMNPMQRCDIW